MVIVVIFNGTLVFAVEVVVNIVVVVVVFVLVVVLAFDDVLLVKVLPDRFVVELVFVATVRLGKLTVVFTAVLVLVVDTVKLKNVVRLVVLLVFVDVSAREVAMADVFTMVLEFVLQGTEAQPKLMFDVLLVLGYMLIVVVMLCD
mmetsp:Transcript_12251/g.19871  ORF Transcript_12251/g.19871 Transcript_12251/m.19871 type:complete len:145 (+) Transcript_12251:486-920(+)